VWVRIDEAAWPATDRTAQPEIGALFQPLGQPGCQRDHNRRGDRFSTAEWCRRNDRLGRLIRHAGPAATLAVRTLPVPMIEPALRALLISVVGGTVLPAPSFHAASGAAIPLPPIAMRTNPEHRLASLAATNSPPENYFSMNRHPPTPADFDNGNGFMPG